MTGLICGRRPIRFTVLFHAMIQKNGPCSSIPTHPLCESLELLKYNVKNIAFVSAIRCPFCTKPFPGGRIEDHLLSCLTSPPLPYNSKLPISSITVVCHSLRRINKVFILIHYVSCFAQQRTFLLRTVGNVPSVLKIYCKERPLHDWPACVSTIRGNPEWHSQYNNVICSLTRITLLFLLNSCIDRWSKVKPCCPEHPFDWFVCPCAMALWLRWACAFTKHFYYGFISVLIPCFFLFCLGHRTLPWQEPIFYEMICKHRHLLPTE